MSQKDKSITIKLTFKEDDLNSILAAANFSDNDPLTVDDVIKQRRFSALKKELEDTADEFVWEIVDGSDEACANDWLRGWGNDKDEEEE